jgi:hypothetical protein
MKLFQVAKATIACEVAIDYVIDGLLMNAMAKFKCLCVFAETCMQQGRVRILHMDIG